MTINIDWYTAIPAFIVGVVYIAILYALAEHFIGRK
jgi:hypothetical protein